MMVACLDLAVGMRSFIRRSLMPVGRSGRCRSRDVLIAKPIPWILTSFSALPFQKKGYPPSGSQIEPSSAKVSLSYHIHGHGTGLVYVG